MSSLGCPGLSVPTTEAVINFLAQYVSFQKAESSILVTLTVTAILILLNHKHLYFVIKYDFIFMKLMYRRTLHK
jgi:hypothetical protein